METEKEGALGEEATAEEVREVPVIIEKRKRGRPRKQDVIALRGGLETPNQESGIKQKSETNLPVNGKQDSSGSVSADAQRQGRDAPLIGNTSVRRRG